MEMSSVYASDNHNHRIILFLYGIFASPWPKHDISVRTHSSGHISQYKAHRCTSYSS